MKNRCLKPSTTHFEHYGGRGITICDEWANDYSLFKQWAESNGYDDSLTIDRIDNDLGYSPSNCRWVTSVAQTNNRRSNVVYEYNGERHNVTEWANIFGIKPKTVFQRLYNGWSFERAITTKTNNN